jgi:putative phosphoribosyl transferase
MVPLFSDRQAAGRALAEALKGYAGREDLVVLALPRGGVPVGFEVARALGAPLDLMLVRKLGTPGQEELAMGAIASGGVRVLNRELTERLGIGPEAVEAVAERERVELERRARAYRGDRPPPELKGRRVILVDDGLATGATMRAAVSALRGLAPQRVVVAVPLAPADTLPALRREADEVVCLETPEPFLAIGRWYGAFPQTSDEEVRELLSRAAGERA